jgi:predicted RNA binding protein with dsRBD fold (UPF0201 family)
MIYSVDVEITAPVKDTEVTDRVVDAITNVFPEAAVTEHPGEVIATTHQLEHLSERLHEQAILDTARGQFHANQRGDTFSFALKKQAAFQGVVNFSVGNPDELGDIHVQVRVTDPSVDELIDYLAPPTQDGTPLEHHDDDT